MTEQGMEGLTRAVLQRLNSLTCAHRAVLVRSSCRGCDLLDRFLNEMNANSFGFTPVRLCGEIPEKPSPLCMLTGERTLESLTREQLQALMEEHETAVLEQMSIGQMAQLRDLRIEGPLLPVVYGFLRQGKKVYAFSDDVRFTGQNRPLEQKARQLLQELEELGLIVVTPGRIPAAVIEKPLITVQDLRKAESDTVCVPCGACFTTTARQYVRERGIGVIRR